MSGTTAKQHLRKTKPIPHANEPPETAPPEPPGLLNNLYLRIAHPGIAVGTVCGIISAVLYTFSNIALRQSVSVDSFFVASMKSLPTVLFLTPMLIGLRLRGNLVTGDRKMVLRFMVLSLVGQIGGNGAFQFALQRIGLAASVPITLGALLIGSALLGRWVLGEKVDRRKAMSIVILIFAVIVLTQSGSSSEGQQTTDLDAASRWIGGGLAAIAGLSYAIFSTNMRLSLQQGMQSSTAMWISGAMGTSSLWIITASRGGFADLPPLGDDLWWSMAAAGLFNFTAFVAITTAMKVLPIVAVHLLNASQVAMAALAAVLLFAEPLTRSLFVGVGLTMLGLMLLATRKRDSRTPTGDEADANA